MDRDPVTLLRQIARMTSELDCRVTRQPRSWLAPDAKGSPNPFDRTSKRTFGQLPSDRFAA